MRTTADIASGCRKHIMRGAAAAVVALALLFSAGQAPAAQSGGKQVVPGTFPPDPHVSFTRVFPFEAQEPQAVPGGDWVQHVFGWLPSPVEENSREQVLRFIRQHQVGVWIDGEMVENPKQYYVPVKRPSDGRWIAVWAYTVPPKPPGTYTFRTKLTPPAGAPVRSAAEYTVENGGRGR